MAGRIINLLRFAGIRERPGEAEAMYKQALEVNPSDTAARNGLAVISKSRGRPGESDHRKEYGHEEYTYVILLCSVAYWDR